ncbi:MAG: hypothetical protein V4538_16275 [Bacteroidota bacterium]
MNFDEAKSLVRKNKNSYKYSNIHATSDGSIFYDADVKKIEAHAKENNLEFFHIKPEKVEVKKPNKNA